MKSIAIFGVGKIGETIAAMLSESGRYAILGCDADLNRAKTLAHRFKNFEANRLEIADPKAVMAILKRADAVISALPFHQNIAVAEFAREAGVHYFDLTEDVAVTKTVQKIATGAINVFMPQCGLAPGFISVAAQDLIRRFDQVHSVKMRVGALPVFPTNRLKYSLTWSTEGLINEYLHPCEAIVEGKCQSMPPLEGYERFSLDGVEYEAFNTSGGVGGLAKALENKVQFLNYKTIRYPGHCELIRFLLNDLRFADRPKELAEVFQRAIPRTLQDKCIVFVEVTGDKGGAFTQEVYSKTVYAREIAGSLYGAIQITTASGVLVPVDLVLSGKLGKDGGVVGIEKISLREFVKNEFGHYYGE